MAANAWRGALEVAGFPVHVVLTNRKESKSAFSFKTLGTDSRPIHLVKIEEGEYAKLEKNPKAKVATIGTDDTRKGVLVGTDAESGSDEYKALSDEAIEQITGAEKSSLVAPRSFVPADTLPHELADKTMTVIPDKKVAGSEISYEQLWNGLLGSGLAFTAEITMRGGSPDAILAVYAKEDGLYAITLPFAEQLTEAPTFAGSYDEKIGKRFRALIETGYEVEDAFNHEAYHSTFRETRRKAVEKVLAGQKPKPKKQAKAPSKSAPDDLMAALVASTKEPKRKPRKKASGTKAKAKA